MTSEIEALAGSTTAELEYAAEELGLPKFRGRQISKWIYNKAVTDFSQMTDLSDKIRAQLAEKYKVIESEIAEKQESKDGTIKLLIKLADGEMVESVYLPSEDRVSGCISTLAGCPMGCNFCATALGGFSRILTAGEIVEQVLHLNRLTPRPLTHLVYMGMGEPLLNFENVIKSVHLVNDEIGIGMRKLTISTVGIVPKIKELADLELQLSLAVSLHATDDVLRSRLIPSNKTWRLAELINACRYYLSKTGRKITFEYLMMKDINDSPAQAKKLASLIRGMQCVVNLIPFNAVETRQGYQRPTNEQIQAFRKVLEDLGVNVTQRFERGADITAACGQLKGKHMARYQHPGLRVVTNEIDSQ